MHALGKKVLKDVSRSFYLSMRILPRAMREPISLGYLLARASDTLADTPELPADVRADMLDGFAQVLEGGSATAWLSRIQKEVMPRQSHEGERVLLGSMEEVFAWLGSLAEAPSPSSAENYGSSAELRESIGSRQHRAILTVMSHILRGQRLDIERFELGDAFQFELDAQLEEYCYLVAGCVGEFWTDVGEISLGDFSRIETSRLRRWGANYGKGLQLINILRDLPKDLENGRCYLPGVDPTDRASLTSEAARWRARARTYLEEGHDYACSLHYRRTRAATALPGLIGERTLDLLHTADWSVWSSGIKVSRAEVYRCAWDSLFV